MKTDTDNLDIFAMGDIWNAVMGEPRVPTLMHKDEAAKMIVQHLASTRFAGWDVWHTGGGCTAFGRNISGNRHILITAWEGCSHEIAPGDDVMIGVYKDDDVSGDPCEGWMSFVYEPTAFSETEIEALIEAFTDAGCAEVQKRLGITDGMTASLFWSDDKVRRVIRDYVCTEINFSNNAN
jgi:hypothetical protein